MLRLEWQLARRVACCALLILVLAMPPAAHGAEEDGPVIAIIDMQEILRESLAVKEMQRRIEDLRSAYQAEFRKKEEALRESDQQLLRERPSLSAEGFALRRQKLEQDYAAAQRQIQKRRQSLEALFGQGMSRVRVALIDIVQDIASRRGADLVLAKTTVVLVRPDLEITDEALQRLNQELPHIDLSGPED